MYTHEQMIQDLRELKMKHGAQEEVLTSKGDRVVGVTVIDGGIVRVEIEATEAR
jgi:heterodisulfide reductase subunit C